MKEIKKETIVYRACDGKEFVNKNDCMEYEAKAFKDINLKHFDIDIPYGDDGLYSWIVYKVNSENEFNMLYAYLDYNYDDIYGIDGYAGNGWYIVQESECAWADLRLMNDVVRDFAKMLADIAEKTLKF